MLIFSMPSMSVALVDVSRFKESAFYGAYVEDVKVGYYEVRAGTKIVKGTRAFVVDFKTYFEETLDKQILVSENSYNYEFDLRSRQIISYTEINKYTFYITKEDLLSKSYTEIDRSGLTATYLGNSTYKLKKTDNSVPKNTTVSLPPIKLDDFLAESELVQNYNKNTSSKEVSVYDLNFHEPSITAAKIVVNDEREYTNNGNSFIHYEVITEDEDGRYFSIYDEDGNLLRSDVLGMQLKLEPEPLAKSFSDDRHIAALSSVPIDKALPAEQNLTLIMLKVFGDNLRRSIIENERQKIMQETADFSLLHLAYGDLKRAGNDENDFSEYLKDTVKFNWKNDALVRINPHKELIGLSDKDKIKALLEFSHNYLEYEFTLDASLDEIIHEQVGDCTEYAQLFVTLARLNGIPAREVGGLAYNYNNENPEFQAHAWAEVWLNGQWKEVDPGWNEFNIDASHITLSSDYLGYGSKLALLGFQ